MPLWCNARSSSSHALIPRLPEPTLVTAVLVEDNTPVKKDQPLFQFDRRPYEYKVQQLQAQLAEAKQNVKVLKLDVAVVTQDATKTKVDLDYQQYQKRLFDKVAKEQAVREEVVEHRPDVEGWLPRSSEGFLCSLGLVIFGHAAFGSNSGSVAFGAFSISSSHMSHAPLFPGLPVVSDPTPR